MNAGMTSAQPSLLRMTGACWLWDWHIAETHALGYVLTWLQNTRANSRTDHISRPARVSQPDLRLQISGTGSIVLRFSYVSHFWCNPYVLCMSSIKFYALKEHWFRDEVASVNYITRIFPDNNVA